MTGRMTVLFDAIHQIDPLLARGARVACQLALENIAAYGRWSASL